MLKQWLKIKYKYIKGLIIAYKEREALILKKNKQAYVMLAANYNNLGDIAITRAQENFLKNNLPDDYEVIVIPHSKTYQKYLAIKKNANKDTIITLIGGGNSGTLYEFIEEPRRFILKFFRKFKIISFPQSVLYDSDDDIYQKEFVELCNKCDDLTLVAREKKSYDIYRGLVERRVKVLLTPDIVFTLNNPVKIKHREDVSFIFRRDKEKSITTKNEEDLINICKLYYSHYSYNDTCDVNIKENGYIELDKFLSDISQKELIVTDRLHGMILAYITDSPCIALDNNNHKIKSTYETWLKEQSLICMSDDTQEIKEVIRKKTKGEKVDLDKYFKPLIKCLLK